MAESGQVQVGGSVIPLTDARDVPRGERVLVLVRPEILELERADGGSSGALVGDVVAHIFLGAITRVKVDAGDHELSADLAGPRAHNSRLARKWRPASPPTGAACLLSASSRKSLPSQTRAVREDPRHPEARELHHAGRVVHGEDGRGKAETLCLAEAPSGHGLLEADGPEALGSGRAILGSMKDAAEVRPPESHRLERGPVERDHHRPRGADGVVLECVEHGVRRLGLLDLDREADAPGEGAEHGVERRHVVGRARVVAHHEVAVPGPHVELDVVGLLGDGELERLDRVLGRVPAGAPVREDERDHE